MQSKHFLCIKLPKKPQRFFGNMKWCLHRIIRYRCCLQDQSWNVYALWFVDELNKSASCAVNLWVEGRTDLIRVLAAIWGKRKPLGDDREVEGAVEGTTGNFNSILFWIYFFMGKKHCPCCLLLWLIICF